MNGLILWSDRRRVLIAILHSENRKTGDMIQTYLLRKDRHPVEAIQDGTDAAICGNCPHRGDSKAGRARTCYVNVGQGPASVYKAYKAGAYPRFRLEEHAHLFAGRSLRIGAYGDPAFVPFRIWHWLTALTVARTGYTHQWRTCDARFAGIVMASCDSQEDVIAANQMGYRAFLVTALTETLPKGDNAANAVLCVNSSHGKTCDECRLCNGNPRAVDNPRNVYIPAHGRSAKSVRFALPTV